MKQKEQKKFLKNKWTYRWVIKCSQCSKKYCETIFEHKLGIQKHSMSECDKNSGDAVPKKLLNLLYKKEICKKPAPNQ